MAQVEVLRRLQGEPPTQKEVEAWIGQPPQLVLVDLSKRCNLWCELHCGYPGQQLRREEKELRGEETEPEFVDVNILKAAYQEIAETWNMKPSLQISADGEPLMHPRALEAICYPAKELGFDVGLTTNGILLNPKSVRTMFESGVRLINISLDAASRETYAVVRPVRDHRFNFFDYVVQNIKKAVELRDEIAQSRNVVTQIMINMILRPEVQHEQEAFTGLGRTLGVDKVSFRPLNTTAGLTPFPEKDTAQRIVINEQGIVTEVDSVPRHPCHFPFTRFSLTVAKGGDVKFVFCPHAWDRTDADIGLYPTNGSLKELWESALLQEVRQWHLSGDFKPGTICASCPDWRFVTGKDQVTYARILSGIATERQP